MLIIGEGVDKMESKKNTLNIEDLKRVAKNALIFLAPVAIVVLQIVEKGGTVEEMLIAVKVWALGVAIDFFRKLKAGK